MIGHSIDNAQLGLSQLGKTNLDDVMRFLSGKGFAKEAQAEIIQRLGSKKYSSRCTRT
jgi:hypothetical protein